MVNVQALTSGRLSSVLGMPIAGLLWSLATFHAHSDQIEALEVDSVEALFVVSLGGIAQTMALWLGFTTVIWAMIRGFGGRVPLIRLSMIVSAAAIPLWIGAPAAAYWFNGFSHSVVPMMISSVCVMFFLHLVAGSLACELQWTWQRAMAATIVTLSFLISFVTLTQ